MQSVKWVPPFITIEFEPKRYFFYIKPYKNCFLMDTFPYKNKILITHNFICWDIFRSRGLKTYCLLHQSSNLPLIGLLSVSFRKAFGLEKYGQILKSTYKHTYIDTYKETYGLGKCYIILDNEQTKYLQKEIFFYIYIFFA